MATIRIRAPGHGLSKLYEDLIRRYRLLLALRTAAIYTLGLAGFLLFTLALDDLFWLAPSTRIAYWVVAVGGIVAAGTWLMRGMGRVRVERRVLHLVDRAFPEMQGAFVAGLQFAQKDPADWERYSPALLLASIRAAETSVRGRDLRPSLWPDFGEERFRRLVGGAAAATALLLGLVLFSRPLRIHALRTLLPFFTFENYRMTVRPGDAEVVAGGPFAVRAEMHVPVTDDVVCLARTDRAGWTPHEMKKAGDAFEYALPAVWKGLEYQVVHGNTESETYRIAVVSAPKIVSQRRRFVFPDYLARPPEEEQEWGPGAPKRVPRGTEVSIDARANDSVAGARLQFLAIPGASRLLSEETCRVDPDGVTIHARIVASESGVYTFLLDDPRGRKDEDPPRFSIDAIADAPPEVKVLSPDPGIEVARNGSATVVLSVKDDHGLSSIAVAVRIERGEAWKGIPGYEGQTEPEQVVVRVPARGADATARIDLSLADLLLAPGDIVRYRAIAEDDDDLSGPNVGASEERTLKVVRPTRRLSRERQGLHDAEKGYNDLVARALAVRGDVKEAREGLARRGELSPAERESLKAASQQQSELVQRMAERADEMEKAAAELPRSQAEEMRRAASELRDVAAKEMSEARDAIPEGLSKPHPDDQLSLLTAENRLDRAIERLREKGRSLSQEPTATAPPEKRLDVDPEFVKKQSAREAAKARLDEIAKKAAELKAKGDKVREETEELARETSKATEATLSPEDREDLERLRKKYDATRAEQDRLKKLREDLARDAAAATPDERRAIEDRQEALDADTDRLREAQEAYRAEKERLGLSDEKREKEAAHALEDLESDQRRAAKEWKKGDAEKSAEAQKAATEDLDRLARETDEDFQQASTQHQASHAQAPLTQAEREKGKELAARQAEVDKGMDDLARETDEVKRESGDDLPLETSNEARDAAAKGKVAEEALKNGDVAKAASVEKGLQKEQGDVSAAAAKDKKAVEEKKKTEELAYLKKDAQQSEQKVDEMAKNEKEMEKKEGQQGQSGQSGQGQSGQGQSGQGQPGQGQPGQGQPGQGQPGQGQPGQGQPGQGQPGQGQPGQGQPGQGQPGQGQPGQGQPGQGQPGQGQPGQGQPGQGQPGQGQPGQGQPGQGQPGQGQPGQGQSGSQGGGDARARAGAAAAEVKARADRISSVSHSDEVRSAASDVRDKAQAYGQAAASGASPGDLSRRREALQHSVDRMNDAIAKQEGGQSGEASGEGAQNGGGGGGRGGASKTADTHSLTGGRGGSGAAGAGAGRAFVGDEERAGEGRQMEASLPAESRGRLEEGRRVDPPSCFKKQVYEYFKAILEQRR